MFIVYLIDDNVSTRWLPAIRSSCKDARIVLVATKTDVRDGNNGNRHIISHDEGVAKAQEIAADLYMECSTRSLSSVSAVFQGIARLVLNVNPEEQQNESKCIIV